MKPRPSDAFLVFCGGGAGATLRVLLTALFPAPLPGSIANGSPLDALPVAVLAINCTGALLLGMLTGFFSSRSDTSATRSLRLALGTGMLGGFTTYSSFTLAVAQLGFAGQWATALIDLFLSLAGGYVMAWAGLRWGKTLSNERCDTSTHQDGGVSQ